MPEEGFLRRWARVKASAPAAVPAEPAPMPPPAAPPAAQPAARPSAESPGAEAPAPRTAPTLDEAAQLTPGSDFSAFVSQGVDKDVRRLALKKLFSDPHFNVMDRLDMYMDDYNKPSPVSAAMLAALQHARGALRRPEEVQAELARLAAMEPPPHPGGVAQPMPLRAAEAPAGDVPGAEVAAAEVAAAEAPAAEAPADDAVLADDAVPGTGLPGDGQDDVQPAAAASHDEGGDPLAPPVGHAHNAEARA